MTKYDRCTHLTTRKGAHIAVRQLTFRKILEAYACAHVILRPPCDSPILVAIASSCCCNDIRTWRSAPAGFNNSSIHSSLIIRPHDRLHRIISNIEKASVPGACLRFKSFRVSSDQCLFIRVHDR